MYLNKEINQLLLLLQSQESLKDIEFVMAYPYARKATVLTSKMAVLSPSSLDLESISVDDEDFYGSYNIDVDLFSPYHFGSPVIFDDMENIVRAVMDQSVCGIKLSSISRDASTECYRLKGTFTFSLAYVRED